MKLTNLEKKLIKKDILKIQKGKLIISNPLLLPKEQAEITYLIKKFYNQKISKDKINKYIKIYQEMKQYLQLIPPFVEFIFQKYSGTFIFIDRDAKPIYETAKIYCKEKKRKDNLLIIPITRNIIPEKYTDAHQNEKGKPQKYKKVKFPQYAWSIDSPLINYSQKDNKIKISEITKEPHFKEEAKKLYSLLKKINLNLNKKVIIIDMGFLGSATSYVEDTIKLFSSNTKTISYLFFSGSTINGFIPRKIPNLKISQTKYISHYETFPKNQPRVKKLIKQNHYWIPKKEILTNEKTKWINNKKGEVYLGVKLVNSAIKHSSKYFFQ